jgi:hypothetical protein
MTHQRTNATHVYGDAETYQERLGIGPINGPLIAAVVIIGSQVEHYLELAIWQIRGPAIPKGYGTDNVPVSGLIKLLRKVVATIEDGEKQAMLETWCDAAHSGFVIRNNIAHGVAMNLGGNIGPSFMRNPLWHGVPRKKDFGSFHADESTLIMVRDSLATLLRIIVEVSQGADDLTSNALAMKALREARSMLGEFASETYNPSFEKY